MCASIDDEWASFLRNDPSDSEDDVDKKQVSNFSSNDGENNNAIQNTNLAPEPTELYISTKSKIAYLTSPIDLDIFWKIPIVPYGNHQNGIIKKQIKINTDIKEDLELLQQRLVKYEYVDEHIITHIDNPTGRIKFKDVRKISIGLSKKEILTFTSKKKQAFYNCIVIILRLKLDDEYKEFHIKIFNTGKIEIPGVPNIEQYNTILKYIQDMITNYSTQPVYFNDVSMTVLVNSNFNCGFYIEREALYDILKDEYNIQVIFDPCTYPGIQCSFYYDTKLLENEQTGCLINEKITDKPDNIIEVSFMIFRTGSVLIVGMCEDNVLMYIYKFITTLLKKEFERICIRLIEPSDMKKEKKRKIKKKTIIVNNNNSTVNNSTVNNSTVIIT